MPKAPHRTGAYEYNIIINIRVNINARARARVLFPVQEGGRDSREKMRKQFFEDVSHGPL